MNTHINATIEQAMRAFMPPSERRRSGGFILVDNAWRVHWDGVMDAQEFATMADAIDELAKRDRAERFVEREG